MMLVFEIQFRLIHITEREFDPDSAGLALQSRLSCKQDNGNEEAVCKVRKSSAPPYPV